MPAHTPQVSYRGDLLALFAGACMPLAFAPFHLYPVAVLSSALLFTLWFNSTPKRAFWRGWFYGLGMFGAGVYWIQISVHQFGLPVLAFSVSMTCLFVAILALFPALTGYLASRLFCVSRPMTLLIVYPSLWTLVEWSRGWILTGFPWLNLGYSQIDSPLAGLAPVFGVYGISYAVVLSAGMVAAIAMASRMDRLRYSLFLVVLWVGCAGLRQIPWTEPAGDTLDVALLQGNIAQSTKFLPEQRGRTLASYLEMSLKVLDKDLIIWPETAIPTQYSAAQPFLSRLQALADQYPAEFVLGIPYDEPDSGRYYNSVITIGEHKAIYRKRHLVPFGEFMPMQKLLQPLLRLLDIPFSNFSAGSPNQAPIVAAGWPIGLSICYEDVFGDEIATALPEANLLINVSNDAWFGDSIAPHQHLQMAQMRALETGRYLLRATNTGVSAIVDTQGQVRGIAPQFQTYTLTATAIPYQGITPYVRLGDWMIVLLLTLLLVYTALPRKGLNIGKIQLQRKQLD